MLFRDIPRVLLVAVGAAALVFSSQPTFGEPRTVSFEECVNVQARVLELKDAWRGHAGTSPDRQELATSRTRSFFQADSILGERWGIRWSPDVLDREVERITAKNSWPDRLLQIYRASGDPILFQECVLRESWVRQEFAQRYDADREIHSAARLEARRLVTMLRTGRLDRLAAHPRRSVDLSESIHILGKEGLPDWQRGVSEPVETTQFLVVAAQLDEKESESLAVYRIPKQSAADWLKQLPGLPLEALRSVAPPLPQLGDRIERIDARGAGAPDDIWDNGSLDFLREKRQHTAVWTGSELLIFGGKRPFGRGDATGYRFDPVLGSWTQMSSENAPTGRYDHAAVWSGSEMLVWGSCCSNVIEAGGKYNPATDTWTPMTTVGAPANRASARAVWTGTEMLIWGGGSSASGVVGDGARYNPQSDSWQPITSMAAPTARRRYSATWTGDAMVIWGGEDVQGDFLNDGSRYLPTFDRWLPMVAPPVEFGARTEHSATWTGSKMVFWGGRGVNGSSDRSGARYDPGTGLWSVISTTGAPLGDQIGGTSFWSGSVVVVVARHGWGGNGGTYDPMTDSWVTTIPPSPSVLGKTVWTGTEIMSWGYARGYRIIPGAEVWTPLPHPGVLLPRRDHTAVWTGAEMIVWGGANEAPPWELSLNDGAAYDPVLDSWSAISSTGVPSGRQKHIAVWTGTEMLIWGSQNIDGGRYDPATDTWTVLPAAIDSCTSGVGAWTGDEFLIWNGESIDRGCRFDPTAGTWQPIATTGSPTAEEDFSSLWTGDRWVLWGGRVGTTNLDTGAAYDPLLDQWSPMTTLGVPTARRKHPAVWTGDSMLVWGGVPPNPAQVGRWDSAANSWSTVSLTIPPEYGLSDTAFCWTGAEMLAFGGPANGPQGASSISWRYDLAQESWRSMTIVREPNERDAHTGVWTGREFLIWGGSNSAGFGTVVSSGGAYQVNADSDGDGIAGAFDCLPLDASAFAIPTEVSGLNFSGPNQLVWNEAASTSGTGTTYTIVRVDLLSLSAQSSWSCLGTNVTLPDFVDLATPTLNQGYAYLVEAENGCGKSGLGADSDGIPRAAPICN